MKPPTFLVLELAKFASGEETVDLKECQFGLNVRNLSDRVFEPPSFLLLFGSRYAQQSPPMEFLLFDSSIF